MSAYISTLPSGLAVNIRDDAGAYTADTTPVITASYPRRAAQIDAFEADLFSIYEMKSLGEIEWFLGIRVSRNRTSRQLWLCQDSYIDKLAAKFKISGNNAKSSPLPVEELIKFLSRASPQDILQFQ